MCQKGLLHYWLCVRSWFYFMVAVKRAKSRDSHGLDMYRVPKMTTCRARLFKFTHFRIVGIPLLNKTPDPYSPSHLDSPGCKLSALMTSQIPLETVKTLTHYTCVGPFSGGLVLGNLLIGSASTRYVPLVFLFFEFFPPLVIHDPKTVDCSSCLPTWMPLGLVTVPILYISDLDRKVLIFWLRHPR